MVSRTFLIAALFALTLVSVGRAQPANPPEANPPPVREIYVPFEDLNVILDNVEAQPLAAVRRALTPTGTLIPNSGRGGRWLGPLGRIVRARMLSGFTRQQLKPLLSVEKRQDLLTLADLLATGQVTPVIDRTYPLDEAVDALRYVGAGHTRGKVVITV